MIYIKVNFSQLGEGAIARTNKVEGIFREKKFFPSIFQRLFIVHESLYDFSWEINLQIYFASTTKETLNKRRRKILISDVSVCFWIVA